MHIIQSGRASSANRSAVRNADRMANLADNGGYRYIDVTNQPKKYPVLNAYGHVIGFSLRANNKKAGK